MCALAAGAIAAWTEWVVSFHAYQCVCVAGYANGVCDYENIPEYTVECAVMESEGNLTSYQDNHTLDGNCNLDLNECASSPCLVGGTCTDSSMSPCLSNGTCLAEFKVVNGMPQWVEWQVRIDDFACECRPGCVTL